ncbi:type II toxin-antitoxin system Phd/YefM family antitoxin [Candidatus Peregrinibacteria bacterium]|jgi:PHD/YefM family antitoxin component YafN of YafNO toxin-antitoxin module|nr:type II toxin-antitoxin system Phd/YefM family antitoxin [Candidatus Peregrinibacteria bacterium]
MKTSKTVKITEFKHNISSYFTRVVEDSEPLVILRSFDRAVLIDQCNYNYIVELLQVFLNGKTIESAIDEAREKDCKMPFGELDRLE